MGMRASSNAQIRKIDLLSSFFNQIQKGVTSKAIQGKLRAMEI